jgi:hypothetical protein
LDQLVETVVDELSKFRNRHDELYRAGKQVYARRGVSLPLTSEFLPSSSHLSPFLPAPLTDLTVVRNAPLEAGLKSA